MPEPRRPQRRVEGVRARLDQRLSQLERTTWRRISWVPSRWWKRAEGV